MGVPSIAQRTVIPYFFDWLGKFKTVCVTRSGCKGPCRAQGQSLFLSYGDYSRRRILKVVPDLKIGSRRTGPDSDHSKWPFKKRKTERVLPHRGLLHTPVHIEVLGNRDSASVGCDKASMK